MSVQPLRVLVSGAAGQIGYILSTRIANGDLLGQRKLILVLWDVPDQLQKLQGTVMEIEDCASPHVVNIIATDNAETACTGVDIAFLVASMALKPGQIRHHLLMANAPIYNEHGTALGKFAKKTAKILCIANPANSMAAVALRSAVGLGPENFSCLCRLDHNRVLSCIARKIGVSPDQVRNAYCWGNHAESLVPDVSKAEFFEDGEWKPLSSRLDVGYLHGEFVETIAQRAWVVQRARGATSAASAACAALDHMRDWLFGSGDRIVSMGLPVPSSEPYGVPSGLFSSFPVRVSDSGQPRIMEGIELDPWTREALAKTIADLVHERDEGFRVAGLK